MFKLISILVVLINAHVNCNPFDAHLNESLLLSKWHLFKQTHHLKSSPHELDLKEFNNFKANYLKVLEHNNGQMKHTYNTRLNQISSLSYHEYLNKYLSKMSSDDLNKMASVVADSQLNVPSPSLSLDLKTRVIPTNFDWRTYGLVSTVKTQSTCGSCWAFATTGAVETIYAHKFGAMKRFSEQDLVDCDTNNWGCVGGYPSSGFLYAYKTGLAEEASFPYKAAKGICPNSTQTVRYKIKGYANIQAGDEEMLKRIVATYGPVAVALDASDWAFGHYSTGIYLSTTCKTNSQNHAVLVVGYGVEDGQDYWIVKNSWGRVWGENGYIRMARNKNNMCGIATLAYYGYM